MNPNKVIFDRRLIYRPFLERLNPVSVSVLESQDLIVTPLNDPRDPDQPPIHVSFANTVELTRGAQLALIGGIGSGKTTVLRLTRKVLDRHKDSINFFIDLANLTDINDLNFGAILAVIGLKLHKRLEEVDKLLPSVSLACKKLKKLASGKTEWEKQEDFFPDDTDIEAEIRSQEDGHCEDEQQRGVWVTTPGLLKPRFPALKRDVEEVRDLVLEIAKPLLESGAQITVLLDGLDRLIRPERFREFAEQDIRALRHSQISIIVVAPLLMWFDKSRFLQEYFDEVKHIPAAISDPEESNFLNQILIRRGAKELTDDTEIAQIAKFSGGVLRDLITLARISTEAAYRDDQDRIGPIHVQSAIRQLGKRYLVGLGISEKHLIRELSEKERFPSENPIAKELLVNRQVLEYVNKGRDLFAVHPALAEVLTDIP